MAINVVVNNLMPRIKNFLGNVFEKCKEIGIDHSDQIVAGIDLPAVIPCVRKEALK